MDALLNWLWQGAVVALVASATLRCLDRARAGVRCAVCWAALTAIALLPIAPSVISTHAPAVQKVAPAAIVTVPDAWWTSPTIVLLALALWAGIYAMRIGVAAAVVRRARARCQPFPAAIERTLLHWQRIRTSGRPVRLVISDRVRAAAVLGCGTPVIAVAPTLVGRLEAEELDRVIVHEWGHVQRRDDLANIGQLFLRAIVGWHPAAWWLDRRLSIERELACDEMVVAVSGGAKSYASCLVKLASLRAAQRDGLLASGALSSAGLARRVTRLVTRKEFAGSRSARMAAAAVVVLLLGLAIGIAPVRIVEGAVAPTLARVVQLVALPPTDSTRPPLIAAVSKAPSGRARPGLVAGVSGMAPEAGPTAAPAGTAGTPPARETDNMLVGEPSPPSPNVDGESIRDGYGAPPPFDTAAAPTLTASPLQIETDSRSVLSPVVIADAGVAVARSSQKAGIATAGAFTRFAKKIAGSF